MVREHLGLTSRRAHDFLTCQLSGRGGKWATSMVLNLAHDTASVWSIADSRKMRSQGINEACTCICVGIFQLKDM